ncbi:MAG: S1 RNA-binding domain-containing protein [Christensenellales bacterium]|jgi:S1 RNA binding domain protein
MAVQVGSILDGVVSGITGFGAFVRLDDQTTGMVHISEVSSSYVKDINDHLKVGDPVKVKVLQVNGDKISLSIRKAISDAPPVKKEPVKAFEDLMSKFMKDSEERQTDIRRNLKNKRSGYSRYK